jgi:hypothetical protein
MDGIEERQPSSEGTSRTRGALDGDWSEGVPGPAYAHGLPSPEPLGLPAEREATAPVAVASAAGEAAPEPAVEAPADWGVAADQAAEPPAAEAEVEVAVEDDFPVTLSEADEIQEEITAPIDLAPGEETAFEAMPLEVEAEAAEVEVLRTEVDEFRTADPTPPPPPPEAASADWLAHPDAAAADTTADASWEEATYASEPTLESAFAAAEAAQASGAESEFAPGPPSAAPDALDAWGEPTVPAPSGSSEVEPWATPVDTPWDGSVPSANDQKAPEIATADAAGELTEEPPEPDWAKGPRELFSPLAKGETLADDGSALPFDPGRTTPQKLELVRGPEALEDPDLLVPVEDATPPMGVMPIDAAPAPVVPGEQRVAIHTRAGQTRRGTVTDLDLSQAQIPLEPQGGGSTETIDHGELKAIFFMLAPGEKAEPGLGQAVRVTFSDGRAIEGHREGDESRDGFFLVPLDAQRTNTRRIYVARDAVSEIVDLPQ